MIKSVFLLFYKRKALTRAFSILWFFLILFACFIPSSNVPKVEIPFIDKWVHLIIFAVFSFCWSASIKNVGKTTFIMILLSCSAIGLLVECIQGSGLVIGRSFEWNDFFADSLGAGIGILLFLILKSRYVNKGLS